MFLKREMELERLKSFLDSPATGAMVYGMRQIGKSSLILKAIEGRSDTLYYLCLDTSLKANMLQLAQKAQRQLSLPSLAFDDLISFFEALKLEGRPFTIVLDEYQNLKKNEPRDASVDSMMQSVVDGLKGTGIKVILCGSHTSGMKALLDRDNPLFNRLQPAIHLSEMDYYDSAAFYPGLSAHEKVGFYAVFGGHPLALSLIDPTLGLDGNIKRLFLGPGSPLNYYVEYVLFQELRKLNGANAVLDTLGNSKLRFSKIGSRIQTMDYNNLARQLNVLLDMEVIEKCSPINSKDDRKKTRYSISSGLVRFYYTYIYTHRDDLLLLGEDAFYRLHIEPTLNTFISCRVEEIARSYFSRLVKSGKLDGVYGIGLWWYDDRKKRKNGEFDCVLRGKDSFDVWEVKYLKAPMTEALMKEEIAKIQAIEGLNVGNIGFVSVSGFADSPDGIGLVSGEDLYAEGL